MRRPRHCVGRKLKDKIHITFAFHSQKFANCKGTEDADSGKNKKT